MIEYTDENLNKAYINPQEIKQILPSSRPDICACYIIPVNGAYIPSHTDPKELNTRVHNWFLADDYQQRALGGGDYAQRRVDQLEGLVRYLMGTCRGLDDDLAKFIYVKLEHTLNHPPFIDGSTFDGLRICKVCHDRETTRGDGVCESCFQQWQIDRM